VLTVGDIHIENFGTWRDAEGRLVWGVNDFDEAARMPYAIDIVRLATSAVLADVSGIKAEEICEAILAGYLQGVRRPKPLVLDRENKTMRAVSVVSEKERKDFWKKFDPEQIRLKSAKEEKKHERPKVRPAHAMRPRYRKALERGRPDDSVSFEFYERTAGTGSLGRRRYFGVGIWRGRPRGARGEGDRAVRAGCGRIAARTGCAAKRLRPAPIAAPIPTTRWHGRVLLRRLSPNDFKIEAKAKGGKKNDGKGRDAQAGRARRAGQCRDAAGDGT